jgi:Domain of unknown function (DUF4160)
VPTIAIFYGIVIQMYWREHGPPHFHAIYQGFEAMISIDSGRVIGGHLPPNALRIVRKWLLRRRLELKRNWQCGRRREPFQQIAGPDEDE